MQPVHFTNYQLRVLLQGSSSEPRRSQTVNDCRLVSGIVRLVSGIVSVVYICIWEQVSGQGCIQSYIWGVAPQVGVGRVHAYAWLVGLHMHHGGGVCMEFCDSCMHTACIIIV